MSLTLAMAHMMTTRMTMKLASMICKPGKRPSQKGKVPRNLANVAKNTHFTQLLMLLQSLALDVGVNTY